MYYVSIAAKQCLLPNAASKPTSARAATGNEDGMTPIWREHQPIYRQIRSYIVTMILDGLVDQSKPLPSVRTLAGKLQVNPLTVSKAYQDLQADGFVEARRGLGMFVTDDARARLLAAEREAFLREEWPDLLRRIEQLELTPADLFRRSTALA